MKTQKFLSMTRLYILFHKNKKQITSQQSSAKSNHGMGQGQRGKQVRVQACRVRIWLHQSIEHQQYIRYHHQHGKLQFGFCHQEGQHCNFQR